MADEAPRKLTKQAQAHRDEFMRRFGSPDACVCNFSQRMGIATKCVMCTHPGNPANQTDPVFYELDRHALRKSLRDMIGDF